MYRKMDAHNQVVIPQSTTVFIHHCMHTHTYNLTLRLWACSYVVIVPVLTRYWSTPTSPTMLPQGTSSMGSTYRPIIRIVLGRREREREKEREEERKWNGWEGGGRGEGEQRGEESRERRRAEGESEGRRNGEGEGRGEGN